MTLKFAGLDTDATWAEAEKNITARRAERSVLRVERDQNAERLRTQIDKRVENPERARLEALALGNVYTEKEPEEKRLGDLNRQIASLDAAIVLLMDRQSAAANQHSVKVCASLKREHDALATVIFDSILAAQKAATNYKQFLDELSDNGIAVHHFPQGVEPHFMEAADKFGRLASYLNEMADIGLLSRSKIPAKLDFKR